MLGANDDLQIYHNGAHNIVQSGNGNISLQCPAGSEIQLAQGGSFEHGVQMIAGGEVRLYHDGSEKLNTTSSGVTVTGTVTATSFSGDGSALTGVESWNQFDTWLYSGG